MTTEIGIFINDEEIVNFFQNNKDINIITELKKIIKNQNPNKVNKQITNDEIVSFNEHFDIFMEEVSKIKKSYNNHFSKYIVEKNPDFKCDICNRFYSINLKGLLIHKRTCFEKKIDRKLPVYQRKHRINEENKIVELINNIISSPTTTSSSSSTMNIVNDVTNNET